MQKRIALFFTIFSISLLCFGQHAKNFSGNVKARESFATLDDSLYRIELSYFTISGAKVEEPEPETRHKRRRQEHHQEIAPQLTEIPASAVSENQMIFFNGFLSIQVRTALFDMVGRKLTFSDPGMQQLSLIDSKPFYGTDGGFPKVMIHSVSFKVEGNTLYMPREAVNDLFQPNLCSTNEEEEITCNCHVYQSNDESRIYIYMLNGEGAAAYEVTWIIENGKYQKRVVDKVML